MPGIGYFMVVFAVAAAICFVLALPITFPLVVAVTCLIQKKRPSRTAIELCAMVEVMLIIVSVALGSFLFVAVQQ